MIFIGSNMMQPTKLTVPKSLRSGVTLVELLIVIAIITLLLQLALPAIESSREAARRTVCQNNLRQVGVATQSHVATQGRFPSGGWGFAWAGDPDRGSDRQQPGGWVYNLLPYLEASTLHDLGRGQGQPAKQESNTVRCQTPLPIMNCPSRRLARAYPYDSFEQWPMKNTTFLDKAAKLDYAANAGDHFSHGYAGPKDLGEGDSPDYLWDDPQKSACEPSKSTGPIYLRSEIRAAQVLDGLSNTYLAGEKYLNPDHYKDGLDKGDDQTLFSGFDADVNRFARDDTGAIVPPRRDTKGDNSWYLFGSAHLDAAYFVYCDGSVRAVSYGIDSEVHRATSNRQDDMVIDRK